ncbi:hypothetical protein CC86DRAFT_470970 [Ophiobolus disseminans]|uniref:Protein kinase domain-containing protein n=1 Tax=Ophiobolus disseminans TaxID=1469910 RepID=A0A6A6ZLX6_9PLEO|nr:hypothetical protein CC86DRAFT_470970 [Ophiobolus disseminans]
MLPYYAIKRAYADSSAHSSAEDSAATEVVTRAFGQQLHTVEREIRNLCHPNFRNHPNILKIMGWGLCMDTMEDMQAPEPRIPLLVVERASCTLSGLLSGVVHGLTSHIASETNTGARLTLCVNLLRDIGRGLDAIHGAGLIHGDIKLENILIFVDGTNYKAKLGDFGLTIAAARSDGVNTVSQYRGTPRWCPPPGSNRYSKGDLYSFDYFAYGVVAWCLLAGHTRSPLPPDEEMAEHTGNLPVAPDLYNAALSDIPSSSALPHGVQMLRSTIVPVKSYGALSLQAKLRRFKSSSRLSKGKQLVETLSNRLAGQLSCYIDPAAIYLLQHREEQCCPDYAWLIDAFIACLSGLPEVDHSVGTSTLLHDSMSDAYAYARTLSRLPPCCSSNLERAHNSVGLALAKDCNFVIVAWLLRSEIGRTDVALLDKSQMATWLTTVTETVQLKHSKLVSELSVCTATEEATKGSVESTALEKARILYAARIDAENTIWLLIVLAESGLRLDTSLLIRDKPTSVLGAMARIVKMTEDDAPVSEQPFLTCLWNLQRFASTRTHSPEMPASLRYFLTGHSLQDRLGEASAEERNEFMTTSLHECAEACYYAAVEGLVMNGFEVNALDAKGETALQRAYASGVNLSRRDSLERDRIIALLRQRSPHDVNSRTLNNAQKALRPGLFIRQQQQSLPMGWDKVSSTTDESTRGYKKFHRTNSNLTCGYIDRYFGSVTFIQPVFSFFSDQRLALGFRKIDVPGQTYYLDLLRFIRPPYPIPTRSKPIKWTFSSSWYSKEAANFKSDRLCPFSNTSPVSRSLNERRFVRPILGILWAVSPVKPAIPYLDHLFVVLSNAAHSAQYFLLYYSVWHVPSVEGCISIIRPYVNGLVLVLALFSHIGAWPLAMGLLLNSAALGILNHLSRNAFLALYRYPTVGNLLVPTLGTHVEVFVVTALQQRGLPNFIIPALIASVVWDFSWSLLTSWFALTNVAEQSLHPYPLIIMSLLYLNIDPDKSVHTSIVSHAVAAALTVYLLTNLRRYYKRISTDADPLQISRAPYRTDGAIPADFWGNAFGLSLALTTPVVDTVILEQHRRAGPRFSRRRATGFIILYLGLTYMVCSNIMAAVSRLGHLNQTFTICILLPVSSRMGLFLDRLHEPQLAPVGDQYAALSSNELRNLLPHLGIITHTFLTWTLLFPLFDFITLTQGRALGLQIPRMDISCIILLSIAVLDACYLRFGRHVSSITLDLFLFHGVCYLGYQLFLAIMPWVDLL